MMKTSNNLNMNKKIAETILFQITYDCVVNQ